MVQVTVGPLMPPSFCYFISDIITERSCHSKIESLVFPLIEGCRMCMLNVKLSLKPGNFKINYLSVQKKHGDLPDSVVLHMLVSCLQDWSMPSRSNEALRT